MVLTPPQAAQAVTYNLQEAAPNTFIYVADDVLTSASCEAMIQQFESAEDEHVRGRVGPHSQIDEAVKRSTDLPISGKPDWQQFDQQLAQSMQIALRSLAQLHPFFKQTRFKDRGYNLQRSRAGEYYHWHVDAGTGALSGRVLVAIWYLNDVVEPGGATEFHFQNLSLQPKQGRLVLFPPYWTHVHRGSPLQSGTKYIATTWLCYA